MSSETQSKYGSSENHKNKTGQPAPAPRPSSSEIRYRVMKTMEIMKEKMGKVLLS